MKISHLVCLFVAAAGLAIAQPAITAVENAASNIPPGLPNANIAQGAMFVVKGSGLGPATFVVANAYPFQTSIAQSSVQISVGGKSVDGIMYYAGATQVAAVLPSSTPVGTGTLTVTYNGRRSATAPVTVVQNNLGVFTVSQSGAGDAIATLGNAFVTPTNAANPGDTVAFWGTGLGPVTFDETNAAQQANMPNIPVEAYVAGKPATVLFQGRNSCCTSVDTVYIRIPDGVSGCATPVAFKIGTMVSNTTTVPVAASGRTCTPTAPGISQSEIATWSTQGSFRAGFIDLTRTVTTTAPISAGGITIPGQTLRSDTGTALFFKVAVQPGAIGLTSAFDIASFGSCTVVSYATQPGSGSGGSSSGGTPPVPYTPQYLDAGPSILVNGPSGTKSLDKLAGGTSVYFGTFDDTGTYLQAGAYTITGPGGADIGSFTANLTLPQPLTWTNQAGITTVNRSQGVHVTWDGGDPTGYTQISGFSFASVSSTSTAAGFFTCSARTSDKQFTVPSVVLLALPPSGSISTGGVSISLPGSLLVTGMSALTTFDAPNLDYGLISSSVAYSSSVTYQ